VSTIPNTSRWESAGESTNTRYYKIEDGILAGVPHAGSVDDAASARSNIALQREYFQKTSPGVCVVFFDNMVSQDKGARGVYQTEADPSFLLGTALVGGSLLSRAMGSFFLGLSKPRVKLKMFANLEDAIAWGRERIKERQNA
jgi:hypothetical protein